MRWLGVGKRNMCACTLTAAFVLVCCFLHFPMSRVIPGFSYLCLEHSPRTNLAPRQVQSSSPPSQLPPHSPPPSALFPTDPPPSNRCDPFPLKFPLHAPFFPCPWFSSSLPPRCSHRLRARLQCQPHSPQSVQVVYEWVSVHTPPSAYKLDDECVARAVRARCYEDGEDLIPNLSHHVMFGGRPLRNYTFLAVLSSVRFLQPCFVFLHADVLPQGPFWDTLVRLVPHLIHIQRPAPKVIFGHKVKVIEHSSDIARLEAIIRFGGLYQDTDYFLLNPFNDVRNYSTVMGTTHNSYCNAVFLGKAGAEFLKAWYDSYLTFDDSQWAYHSTIVPYNLHRERPDLPFHEIPTLIQPYYQTIRKLFYDSFMDWKRLHGIHLYTRPYPGYFKERYDLRNSSLGQVTRHILFGDSGACFGTRGLSGDVARMTLARATMP